MQNQRHCVAQTWQFSVTTVHIRDSCRELHQSAHGACRLKQGQRQISCEMICKLILSRCHFHWVSVLFLIHLLQHEALMVFLLSGRASLGFSLKSIWNTTGLCCDTTVHPPLYHRVCFILTLYSSSQSLLHKHILTALETSFTADVPSGQTVNNLSLSGADCWPLLSTQGQDPV